MTGAALALCACATDTPIAGPVPDLGFQHLSPINLAVSKIVVTNAYQSPLKAPNAEHRFPTPPAAAITTWTNARLKAVDSSAPAMATLTIEDASVIENKLQKTKGFKGLFTYEPTERYDATAIARLEVNESRQGARATIRVEARRSVEVSENATLAEREKAWFEMIEALMGDFNDQMNQQIDRYLARWIR
ncbi:MAG: hypothetical protein OQK24_02015 [Magnetovibrio sp.]|nr:hypothetical protein [Magnetovibrio sp.]